MPYRLTSDAAPPSIQYIIEKGPDYFGYIPEDVDALSVTVGRRWFVEAMERCGFQAEHLVIADEATGIGTDWFVGVRRPRPTAPRIASALRRSACTVCGAALPRLSARNEACPTCNSRARTRSLKVLLKEEVAPILESQDLDKPALAFAMDSLVAPLVAPYFDDIVSISTFDNYRRGHISGVALDDLSRFKDASFGAFFGLACFDYVQDMGRALEECARVLDDGGVFFTTLMPYRLLDGHVPPAGSRIDKRPGYFDTVPKGVDIYSMTVGRRWFLDAMEEAGLEARTVVHYDRASGVHTTWFIGIRDGDRLSARSRLAASVSGGTAFLYFSASLVGPYAALI
jgi:hypothetical protein